MSSLKKRITSYLDDRIVLMGREKALIDDLEVALEDEVKTIQSQVPAGFKYHKGEFATRGYQVQLNDGDLTLYIDPPADDRKPLPMMLGDDLRIRLNERLKDTYRQIEQNYGIKVKGFSTEHLVFD